jgi:hypothetical protein
MLVPKHFALYACADPVMAWERMHTRSAFVRDDIRYKMERKLYVLKLGQLVARGVYTARGPNSR